MYVSMQYSLSGGEAIVHADVEAVWLHAAQETRPNRAGDSCYIDQAITNKATVESVDYERNLVWLKRDKKCGDLPPTSNLIPNEYVSPGVIDESIEETVRIYEENGALPAALSDFLFRRAPRLSGPSDGPLVRDTDDLDRRLLQLALSLQDSTLCVQGPPGSGKT